MEISKAVGPNIFAVPNFEISYVNYSSKQLHKKLFEKKSILEDRFIIDTLQEIL